MSNPMSFFSNNVDCWGAAEWFDRLANAIREQDKAVLVKDDINFDTYKMIAASSAMRLVRDYEDVVCQALRPIKKITWSELNGMYFSSHTITGNSYNIAFEEGKYYPLWDASLPGYKTLEEAQKVAQDHYEAIIRSAFE